MKKYREYLQPSWKKELDDIVEWTLLRPISIYLSVPMGKLGLKAVHASFLCFASALAGSLFLVKGTLGSMAVGGLLIWLSFLLDCVDGELARYHQMGSWRGTYLDFLIGGINDIVIVVAMSCGVAVLFNLDTGLLVLLGAFLAGTEKLVDLYQQSVFYRNAEKLIESSSWQDEVLVEGVSCTPKNFTVMQKLIRAPFTTFGRVNIYVVGASFSWMMSLPELIGATYILIAALSLIYIVVVFKNYYINNKVEFLLAEKSTVISKIGKE